MLIVPTQEQITELGEVTEGHTQVYAQSQSEEQDTDWRGSGENTRATG